MKVDAHCHLPESPDAIADTIHAAKKSGITKLFLGGISPEDWQRQQNLRIQFGDLIATSFGLHPWYVNRSTESECENGFTLLTSIIAGSASMTTWDMPWGIGETGLDHAVAKTSSDRQRQRKWFKRHLELSLASGIPVVIHSVKAYGTIIECLSETTDTSVEHESGYRSGYGKSVQGKSGQGKSVQGMVHAFRGERNIIKEFSKAGILMSIGPNAFFGKEFLHLAEIPDHLLTIESDAPQGAMGRRHDCGTPITPSMVIELAGRIAKIRERGETPAQILNLAAKNLERVFARSQPRNP